MDGLISDRSVAINAGKRLSEYTKESIRPALQEEYEGEGWVVDRKLKASVRMRKLKSHDVLFEDRVWAMMARLGFTFLNRDRQFRLPYGPGARETKQLDVIAIDDDVIVVVECKSSRADQPPVKDFRREIEIIRGYREGLIRHLKTEYPDHKVKFVFATNNYELTSASQASFDDAGIAYMDEEAVDYYLELSAHLGRAAKYQLLGTLFQGTKIAGMDSNVAAIQGRMGGLTYFSFLIEPARLLKMAYVLHRSKANMRWMPTYQRVIKKSRLSKVQAFVESGGVFPNSLIINIDSGGKKPNFERASLQAGSSRIGLLKLPQTYKSAFVIDGQHRLYGFADSRRSESELVPVVAFFDLPADEQVKLFMQINENQQAVPKNLQDTLNSDLLWKSENFRERSQALKLRSAQDLGENKSSPLRGRVIGGEDKSSNLRCISMGAISRGIDKGSFVGTATAAGMLDDGLFYRGDHELTFKPLQTFLYLVFGSLRHNLPDQWNLGRGEGGFVFTNNGTEAMLRVVGDIVRHAEAADICRPRVETAQQVFDAIEPMLLTLFQALASVSADGAAAYRTHLGSGAVTTYWRNFQIALRAAEPVFQPHGLDEYLALQAQEFNTRAYEVLGEIELYLKSEVRTRLMDRLGSQWYKRAVPQKIYEDATALAAKKRYQAADSVEVDWWDSLNLSAFHQIFQKDKQIWDTIFGDDFTAPSDRSPNISWRLKSGWMNRLIEIRNNNAHEYRVSPEEFDYLRSLQAWLQSAS
jgi:DNA sulfur modification protein DndB